MILFPFCFFPVYVELTGKRIHALGLIECSPEELGTLVCGFIKH